MKIFMYIFLFCIFFIVLPVGVAVFYDFFYIYKKARRKYQEIYGPYVDQNFVVVEQNPQQGSILSNQLSLGDVYIERGIVSYTFQMGDEVKILPFPAFEMFSKRKSCFALARKI